MGIRGRFAREFALAVAGVSSDPIADVERYVETTTAPAVGSERLLSRGGIVEGNLILRSPDGTTTYARGVHYVETALGFDNLAIPAGTPLSADYFYRPDTAAGRASPGGGHSGTTARLRSRQHDLPCLRGRAARPVRVGADCRHVGTSRKDGDLVSIVIMAEQSAPPQPPNAGDVLLYPKAGAYFFMRSDGLERPLGANAPFSDAAALVVDAADVTKGVRIKAGGVSPGFTRTIIVPDADVDLGALATDAELAAALQSKADLVAGKVPLSQMQDTVLGGLDPKGTWNASTNTPNLTTTPPGDPGYYKVTVAGTTNLSGITDWQIGDWAVWIGGSWDKVDNSEAGAAVPDASETTPGKAEIATQPEVDAGTDDLRIVTASKFATRMTARLVSYVKTVNGTAPDANGNVTVAAGSAAPSAGGPQRAYEIEPGTPIVIPINITELFSSANTGQLLRFNADLTNATDIRIVAVVSGPSAAGPKIDAIHQDAAGTGWVFSPSSTGTPVRLAWTIQPDGQSVLRGPWTPLGTVAKAERLWRLVGQGGGGSQFNIYFLAVEVR